MYQVKIVFFPVTELCELSSPITDFLCYLEFDLEFD